jgi:hypothetical protein
MKIEVMCSCPTFILEDKYDTTVSINSGGMLLISQDHGDSYNMIVHITRETLDLIKNFHVRDDKDAKELLEIVNDRSRERMSRKD